MAVISMKIPALERAIRSACIAAQASVKAFNKSVVETYGAAIQAPIKAIGNPAVAICGAVGKSLSAATRIHLETRNSPKETKS